MDRAFPFHPLQPVALAALAAGLALTANAQAPAATQVATVAQPNTPQQAPAEAVPTIRAYSNLVVIDVVVTDNKGNAIHGLTKDQFQLFENNQPQNVRHFEEHSALPASDAALTPVPKLPPGLFTNKTAAPASGAVNVLLLDYLNTPLTAQPSARKQLIDFLNHAPPGTQIAIFGLTNRLQMLQGFTSDMEVLKAALSSKKGAPQASDILSDAFNGGPDQNNQVSNALNNDPVVADGILATDVVNDINRFEAITTAFQEDVRAQYTLKAFDTLARYLMGIPGRKNVIWYSGSFPLDVEPDVNLQDPSATAVRNDEEVRITDNLLTRAQVAVYPVDARGVMINPALNFASGDTNPISANSGIEASNSQMAFLNETAQEHLTMEMMAEDTGGTPMYNTNDLTQAISKAVQNGSNYYTLSYTPTNTDWDARFRSVKVKVDQPGVKLSYRNGYYAVDPNDHSKFYAALAATAGPPPTTMATAMLHGGPDPAEIPFKVRIRPSDLPPGETPLKTNQKNPDPKVKVEGPYRAYGVDLVPDAQSVSCSEEANGNRHCALEMWTFVYNRDGERLITASNRLHTVLTPGDYKKLLAGGLAFHQMVSVPVKGQYFLRTAIHDMVSDRVGAVEVPVAAVARLDPLQPLPTPPAAAAGAAPAASQAAPENAPEPTVEAAPVDAPAPPPPSVPVVGAAPVPSGTNQGTPTLKRRTPSPSDSTTPAPADAPK